jgi:glycosyltransferase involved in cell wall biosynthesis
VVYGERYGYRVLSTEGAKPPKPDVALDPIYPSAGSYSPGLKQNLRVMMHGLRPRGASIYHYFFAPNPISSLAGKLQCTVARIKSVQTVCSAPASFDKANRLFFGDVIIVLSEDTKHRMIEAGVQPALIHHIRPGIEPLEKQSPDKRMENRRKNGLPEKNPIVLFPGDYEFSEAARTVARATPLLAQAIPGLKVVFACRIKRPDSRIIRDEIANKLRQSGQSENALFPERVASMPDLVGAADVVILPSESLYAKMDVPLVLLEAMSQGVPLVLADVPPLNELLSYGTGMAIPPKDPEALAAAVKQILNNENLRLSLGEKGMATQREFFSAKNMARDVETIYDEVLVR